MPLDLGRKDRSCQQFVHRNPAIIYRKKVYRYSYKGLCDQLTVRWAAVFREGRDQVTVDGRTKLPWITGRFGQLSTGFGATKLPSLLRDQVTVVRPRQINELKLRPN